jgi:transcriptional regulator with XRE-family HTH domain
MKYNYSKLLGRMKERGITQERLAAEIGVNETTLNQKLNNKYEFKGNEIDAICRVLDIPNDEIGAYFFAK